MCEIDVDCLKLSLNLFSGLIKYPSLGSGTTDQPVLRTQGVNIVFVYLYVCLCLTH